MAANIFQAIFAVELYLAITLDPFLPNSKMLLLPRANRNIIINNNAMRPE